MAPRCLMRPLTGVALVAAVSTSVAAFAMTSPAATLSEAIRLDLAGETRLAFTAYLRAAEAGLPDAEFDVAVMLDSGRGVTSDLAQAATWYARAAAHGQPRAAYNLAQLYEAGQGVPRNTDMARAWFEVAKLPAARAHLAEGRQVGVAGTGVTAANLVAPAADSRIMSDSGDIELVWTSPQQPEPATFYVELRCADRSGPVQSYAGTTRVSSAVVHIPAVASCTWRVTTLAKDLGQYVVSGWSGFRRE